MLCHWVSSFEGSYCLHLQGQAVWEEGEGLLTRWCIVTSQNTFVFTTPQKIFNKIHVESEDLNSISCVTCNYLLYTHGVAYMLCYVMWSFLHFMLPEVSSILCYLEFLPFYVTWSFFHVVLPGVSSILCYLAFLPFYVTCSSFRVVILGISSMLCYLEFLPFYVTWSFFHVVLPGVSSILCYLEFLPFYVTCSSFRVVILGISSMLCYLEFLPFYVTWSFFHVMLPEVPWIAVWICKVNRWLRWQLAVYTSVKQHPTTCVRKGNQTPISDISTWLWVCMLIVQTVTTILLCPMLLSE